MIRIKEGIALSRPPGKTKNVLDRLMSVQPKAYNAPLKYNVSKVKLQLINDKNLLLSWKRLIKLFLLVQGKRIGNYQPKDDEPLAQKFKFRTFLSNHINLCFRNYYFY